MIHLIVDQAEMFGALLLSDAIPVTI